MERREIHSTRTRTFYQQQEQQQKYIGREKSNKKKR